MNLDLRSIGGDGVDESQIMEYGCSLYSSYIPIYALYSATKSKFFNVNKKTEIFYYKCTPRSLARKNMKYADLWSFWSNRISPTSFKNASGNYIIKKYYLADKNNKILACIALKADVDFTKINKDFPDKDNFIMLLNKDFNSEKHINLYRKFSKEIIANCDLDILYTKNIEKYCFNLQRFLPKFKNIEQMYNYCNKINDMLCLKRKKQV